MSHPSERRWAETSARVSGAAEAVLTAVLNGEHQYQELLVDYQWSGGSDQTFAQLLFETVPPTTEQVNMVSDLREALLACHDLYQAIQNQVVPQKDRATALRTMT